MKQTDKNKNLHIIEGLIAIVLLVGIVWFLMSGRQATAPSSNDYPTNPSTSPATTSQSTTNPTTATNTPSGNDVVVVSTQIKGSKVVTIDNLNLSKAGFIRVVSGNGPKATIGISKLLSTGTKQDLEIPVSEKLIAGGYYYVEIYLDDGDKKLNIDKDIVPASKNGVAVFEVK